MTRAAARHGTDGGYFRHQRGTKTEPPSPPCGPCLAAHAAANRGKSGKARARRVQPDPVPTKPCPGWWARTGCGEEMPETRTLCPKCARARAKFESADPVYHGGWAKDAHGVLRPTAPTRLWADTVADVPDPELDRAKVPGRRGYDHAVVERFLSHGGERPAGNLTREEAAEIVRRLTAMGVSHTAMERLYRLKPERYTQLEGQAS